MEYTTELIGVLLTIISTYISVTVASVKNKTEDISKKINEINGSVKGLKTWAEGHEKLDDERFNHIREGVSAG